MKQVRLSHVTLLKKSQEAAARIADHFGTATHIRAYAIPRGGIPAAYLVQRYLPTLLLVNCPEDADIFIDDLVDSGATKRRYENEYSRPVFVLIDKTQEYLHTWVSFPWEHTDTTVDKVDHATRLLEQHNKPTDSWYVNHVLQFVENIHIGQAEESS